MKSLVNYISESLVFEKNFDIDENHALECAKNFDFKSMSEDELMWLMKTQVGVVEVDDDTLEDCIRDFCNTCQLNGLHGKLILNWINTSKVTSFYGKGRSKLHGVGAEGNIDISKWDVSNVENMDCAFSSSPNRWTKFNCDLSGWNTKKLKSADNAFNGCTKFEGKGLDKWDVSSLERAAGMFNRCKKFNQDLSKWDVKNLIYAPRMFQECSSFEGKGLDKWDISDKANFDGMFLFCKNLKFDYEKYWNKKYLD